MGEALFDNDLNHPLNKLSDASQMELLALTLKGFREFPLCGNGHGYSMERLRFYDDVLGSLIRFRDEMERRGYFEAEDAVWEFARYWEYHGDIYRIIGKALVFPKNGEPYLRMPHIRWHGMIASWSKSYDFTQGFNKIYRDEEYTIIHARTGSSAGIDIDKLTAYFGCSDPYKEGEQEVIFPMREDCVVKVYKHMTPARFKELMEHQPT